MLASLHAQRALERRCAAAEAALVERGGGEGDLAVLQGQLAESEERCRRGEEAASRERARAAEMEVGPCLGFKGFRV